MKQLKAVTGLRPDGLETVAAAVPGVSYEKHLLE